MRQRSRVMSIVCELVADRMAQHMRMDREWKLSRLAGTLNHSQEPTRCGSICAQRSEQSSAARKPCRYASKIAQASLAPLPRKAIELAKVGDGLALRLCIERLLPPRRDRPVEFELSKLETAADAAKALSDILQAVSAGDLTPSEAEALGSLVAGYSRAIEIVDLEERVARLENRRAA